MCWLPYGVVVGEDDAGGVELLESVYPGWCGWQGWSVLIAMRLPRQGVAAVRSGVVVALAGHDHCPVQPTDDKGLMPSGVSRSWQYRHTGQDLSFAFELFVAQPGCVNELGQGVVRCV